MELDFSPARYILLLPYRLMGQLSIFPLGTISKPLPPHII
jgi:hypothetical protein